jgi:hypothetical protein
MYMKSSEVRNGRIAGIKFAKHSGDEVCFVVWNQWRSGAKSLFSKYLAEQLVSSLKVSSVYCLDRIASGGMSDNNLTKYELKNMQNKADLQFVEEYAKAVVTLTKNYKKVVIVGSSGGTLAVQACVDGLQKISSSKKYYAVMVEPTGLRPHGIYGNKHTSLAHGFSRHVFAYRHRVGRGWWTPMDREQYFTKGAMLEKRGIYFASGKSLNDLSELIGRNYLDLDIYISDDSHMHSAKERKILKDLGTDRIRIHVIKGNHDKICQPVSLAKLYLKSVKL